MSSKTTRKSDSDSALRALQARADRKAKTWRQECADLFAV